MATIIESKKEGERGSVVVFVSLGLVMLLSIAALVVDLGMGQLNKTQLQNAADAAALAGAGVLDGNSANISNARTAAQNVSALNKVPGATLALDLNTGNAGNGDVVVGYWDISATPPTFTPRTSGTINAVKVVARRTGESGTGIGTNSQVATLFARIFGQSSISVQASAIAYKDQSVPSGSGFSILSLGDLTTNGNVTIDAPGDIIVNGKITQNGGKASITTSGKTYYAGTASGSFTPAAQQRSATPDPLANLAAPTKPANAGTGTTPGYYTSPTFSGDLKPGLYYIDGGMTLNNVTSGAGVTFYIKTGGITVSGTNNVMSAPTSGTYQNILFFQARDNDTPYDVGGNKDGIITASTGSILYLPDSSVKIHGNPYSGSLAIIAKDITLNGKNATLGTGSVPFPSSTSTLKLVQ